MRGGMPARRAIIEVDRTNPGLRAQVIDETNAARDEERRQRRQRSKNYNLEAIAKWLAAREAQRGGSSAQTRNHYLKAIKAFTRWLRKDGRAKTDPLEFLSQWDAKTDRRHDRRAMTKPEFARLVFAAMEGPPVKAVAGPDRAMLYSLAAWTGYRRGELASLTPRSFDVAKSPPTVTVGDSGHTNRCWHSGEDRILRKHP